MSTTVPFYCNCTAENETTKDFEISQFNTIANVPELQWNQHIPETNRLMQCDELRLVESTQQGKMQFRYVFIKRQGLTVGVIYFQVVRFTGNDLLNYFPAAPGQPVKRFIYNIGRGISEPLVKLIDVKLLVSGNVFMTGENGCYFNSNISPEQRGALLRKAIKQVATSDAQIRAVLVGDLYEPKTGFDSGFKAHGYNEITVESDMGMRLNPEWKNLADYIAAMSSKYRVRAKKVFALCKENNVTRIDLDVDQIALHQARLFDLYNMVMARAEFKLAALTPDFFVRQKQLLGDNYRVFAYFKDGNLIGFISLFNLHKRVEVHYTGMDKDITRQINLYQHMLYDMIEFGIESRVEKLHFGRTAPEIKSTVGAVPSPMYGYVKHFNPLFNALMVRTFTSRLKPKQYTIREPFKTGS